MYSPAHFAETRLEVLSELIRAQPLATLVSQCPQGLTADHIPLQWHPEPAPFGRLRGHVARANPLWREADRTTDVLAVFSGPQAYITPAWYATKAETGRVVPTWNYIAVHASGRLNVIDDPRWLRLQIEALTAQQEAGLAVPWQVDDAPNDYIDTLLRNIVGIEIIVTKLLGPVNTYAVAALSVKNPPGEARAAGLGDSKAKVRNDGRRIFGHNPSGRGREPPLRPRSLRQGNHPWLRLPRCTGGSRPPSQRSHRC